MVCYAILVTQAAIPKYQRLDDLNKEIHFLTVLKAGRPHETQTHTICVAQQLPNWEFNLNWVCPLGSDRSYINLFWRMHIPSTPQRIPTNALAINTFWVKHKGSWYGALISNTPGLNSQLYLLTSSAFSGSSQAAVSFSIKQKEYWLPHKLFEGTISDT